MSETPLLSLLIWPPLLAGLTLLLWPGLRALPARMLAVGAPLAGLLLSLKLWLDYDPLVGGMQFLEQFPWV